MMTAPGIELSASVYPRATPPRPKAVTPKARRKSGTTVRIWPFGLLAMQVKERPLELSLPAGATAADMIAAIGERCGPEFVRQLMPERGELARCCRLFVDGEPVEELSTTLSASGEAVDVEIILIMGYEGG